MIISKGNHRDQINQPISSLYPLHMDRIDQLQRDDWVSSWLILLKIWKQITDKIVNNGKRIVINLMILTNF